MKNAKLFAFFIDIIVFYLKFWQMAGIYPKSPPSIPK